MIRRLALITAARHISRVLKILAISLILTANAVADDKEIIAKAREVYLLRDEKAAIELLKPLTDKRNPEAMLLLSTIYGRAEDLSLRNFVLAESLLDAAVELNYPPALSTKSRYFLERLDVKSNTVRDAPKGIRLLERASELGDSSASMELMYRYQQGRAIEQSPHKAFQFAKRALDQGSEWSVVHLARSYRDGSGTEVDRARAYAFFFIDCYRPNNDGCKDALRLSASLTQSEKQKGIAIASQVIREQPSIVRIEPPLLSNSNLLLTNKTQLIETYKKVSALYRGHQTVTGRYYTESTRSMIAHLYSLQSPWRPKEWGSSHPRWPDSFSRFVFALTKVDAEARASFERLVQLPTSLDEQISKELSQDDLRDLIAFYKSSLGESLRSNLELAIEIKFDSAKRYWEKAAASGRPIEEYMAGAGQAYKSDLEKLSIPQQRQNVECANRLPSLLHSAELSFNSSFALESLLQHSATESVRYKEWLKLCARTDYVAQRAIQWIPVAREAAAIAKWRDHWMRSAEMKALNDRYLLVIQQLQAEEGERLKPPPKCPEGYWPESKRPDAPCVKRTDGRLRD